jgi:ketosteroid isomerase-like protein
VGHPRPRLSVFSRQPAGLLDGPIRLQALSSRRAPSSSDLRGRPPRSGDPPHVREPGLHLPGTRGRRCRGPRSAASSDACSPTAARQLASRARRRVRGVTPVPDRDLREQRPVVEAFLAAVRGGDFEGLLAVLDPDVVLRADGGALWVGATRQIRGAETVARSALTVTRLLTGYAVQHALVNGAAGIVTREADGQPVSVMGFTVRDGKIVEIDVLMDPERLRHLDLTVLDPRGS